MKVRLKKVYLSVLNESVFYYCMKSQYIIRMIGRIVYFMKNCKFVDVWKLKMIVKIVLNEVVVYIFVNLDNVQLFYYFFLLKKKRKGMFFFCVFVFGGWVWLQVQVGYLKLSMYGMNYILCENQVNYDILFVFWFYLGKL